MDHEKTSVAGHRTLYEGSAIHHSNSDFQVTHDMYINVYLMPLVNLTLNRGTTKGHVTNPDKGNIRVEFKIKKPLPEIIACIFYLQYDNSVRVDTSQTVSTDF